MNFKIIYIRNETIKDEYRTPLVPNDVKILIENGFTIYVESNENCKRFFKDKEYTDVGAIVTEKKWHEMENLLIIGIKELSDIDLSKLNSHTHMYFSHSFNKKSILIAVVGNGKC